jgi:hypothetical protein
MHIYYYIIYCHILKITGIDPKCVFKYFYYKEFNLLFITRKYYKNFFKLWSLPLLSISN